MPSKRRSYLILPLFIVLCSLTIGTFKSGNAWAATTSGDAMDEGLKSFTKVLDLVEQNFADPVKADKAIYDGAIPGMLHTLDPHSNFFDPKAYAAMRGRAARALFRHRHDSAAATANAPSSSRRSRIACL